MKVSILIATRNRARQLAETVESFRVLKLPPSVQAELIVIDNGSTDETQSLLAPRFLGNITLRGFLHPEIGKAAALNAALDRISGDTIVLTDDDVCPHGDWLKNLLLPIAEDRADAVAGAVKIAPNLIRPWMTSLHRAFLADTSYLDPHAPASAVGANMAFSRRVLGRVPGFDPELGPGKRGLWEDTLFSLQICKAGFRLVTASNAVVVHHFDASRLSRESWLIHARNEARSSAYVAWHWRHDLRSYGPLRMAEYRFRLLAKRVIHPRELSRKEGITDWEMNLVAGINFERYYLLERRHRPAYERLGLVKRA